MVSGVTAPSPNEKAESVRSSMNTGRYPLSAIRLTTLPSAVGLLFIASCLPVSTCLAVHHARAVPARHRLGRSSRDRVRTILPTLRRIRTRALSLPGARASHRDPDIVSERRSLDSSRSLLQLVAAPAEDGARAGARDRLRETRCGARRRWPALPARQFGGGAGDGD